MCLSIPNRRDGPSLPLDMGTTLHIRPTGYGARPQVKLSKRGVVGGTFGEAVGLIDVLPGRAVGSLT